MKKFEIIMLIVFLFASTIYSFILPDQQVEAIKINKEIVVYVEGEINQKFIFKNNPTIKEVLEKVGLGNNYHFNEAIILDNEQTIYIPILDESLISLNDATIEELMSIKGIGEVTAKKIVEFRGKQRFELIEDIMKISGVGEKTYYKLRGYLCL